MTSERLEQEIFSEADLLELSIKHDQAMLDLMKCMNVEHKVDIENVSLIILPDDAHTDLNIKYLDHDYSTDILTFDLSEDESIQGEIYINAMVCRNNASEYGVSVENEFYRLMIHGLLHLIGFDDHTDEEKREMTAQEDRYLQRLTEQGFM